MTTGGNGGETSVFKQSNWTVQGDVYNIAGDLILSNNSDADDFSKALAGLRKDLQNLEDLDPGRQRVIEADLASIAEEADNDRPAKDIIVSRLNTIRATLEASSETVKGALELGKVVAKIAIWAGAFFA